MHIKECIEKIVEEGNKEEMKRLSEMLNEVVCHFKICDPEQYKKYKMELYTMAYGYTLTKEMAEEIIANMQPYHMRWSLEETEEVRKSYGLNDIKDIDFWVVMNSKYNDNKDTVEHFTQNDAEKQLEMYVCLAKDFINDKDAKKGKVFLYFTEIPE